MGNPVEQLVDLEVDSRTDDEIVGAYRALCAMVLYRTALAAGPAGQSEIARRCGLLPPNALLISAKRRFDPETHFGIRTALGKEETAMTCPICDQKPMNCDCTETERRQFCEIEELRLTPEERLAIEAAVRIIDAYEEEMDGFPSGAAARLRKLLERLG